jgi:hypothetical protein
MPTIRVPFAAPETPVLPLSAPSIASAGRVRSTGRRLNYNIKSRASHYSLPLTLGGVLALLFFVLRYNHSSHTQPDRPHLYPRSNDSPYESSNNGISLLLSDEDELIAEDDLFWDSYTESDPISDEEIEAEKEIAAHRLDVQQRDRKHALQAMIWWLAEGGVIPSNWEMPSASQMKKISGRGMEKMLESIDKGDEEEPIFAEGWAEYAKKMYRTVVFSKVSGLSNSTAP